MLASQHSTPRLGAGLAPHAERRQLGRSAINTLAAYRPAVDAERRLVGVFVPLDHLPAAAAALVNVRPVVVAPREEPFRQLAGHLAGALGALLLEAAGLEGAFSGAIFRLTRPCAAWVYTLPERRVAVQANVSDGFASVSTLARAELRRLLAFLKWPLALGTLDRLWLLLRLSRRRLTPRLLCGSSAIAAQDPESRASAGVLHEPATSAAQLRDRVPEVDTLDALMATLGRAVFARLAAQRRRNIASADHARLTFLGASSSDARLHCE